MKKAVFVLTALAAGGIAQADFLANFELPDYNASVGGVPLNGQQGWYIPPVVGSVDNNVFNYVGNAPGFVQNPVGGNQFAVGASLGGSSFARGQFPVPFAPGQWTVSWDMAPLYAGVTPAAANLSSFSLNHSTLAANTFKGFIALNNFIDVNNPSAGWKAEWNVFNAAGGALNNQSPGAFWANLQTNHWYRQYVTFNLATNEISQIALLDLHTGASSSANPAGWYLTGGSASALPMPDALRIFAGGSAGNTMGWDNILAVPAPASSVLVGAGLLVASRRRRA
jgi:hypothetical protein